MIPKPGSILPLALSGGLLLAIAAGAEAGGLLEDSQWQLLNRSVYDAREYRHGGRNGAARNAHKPRAERNGYAEEWAWGLMGSLQSGFTQGSLGLGVDAHLYHGQQLDSGGGRAGKARLLGLDNDGHPKEAFSRAGAALKAKVSATTLHWGEQRVKTPVFGSSDSRLLPETATGLLLSSGEIAGLRLVAGHFTESTDRNATSHDQGFVVNYSNAPQGTAFDLAGAAWEAGRGLSASLYAARYEDSWNQHYLGLGFTRPLGEDRDLRLSFNLYRTLDTGRALSGVIDNTAWSLFASHGFGPHRLGFGYQQVDGDTPFDYVTRGAIYLGNAVQLSDFNAPNERSWQLRYDLDLASFGLPGGSLAAAWVRGSGIDGSHVDPHGGYAWLGYGQGGRHWERDLLLQYQVPDGVARGLRVSLMHNLHRANAAQAELDTDQLRLAVEFPLGGGLGER